MRYVKGAVGFLSMVFVTPFVVLKQFGVAALATLLTPFTAARLCYFYNKWPWESLQEAKREMNEKRMKEIYDSILEELGGPETNH